MEGTGKGGGGRPLRTFREARIRKDFVSTSAYYSFIEAHRETKLCPGVKKLPCLIKMAHNLINACARPQ